MTKQRALGFYQALLGEELVVEWVKANPQANYWLAQSDRDYVCKLVKDGHASVSDIDRLLDSWAADYETEAMCEALDAAEHEARAFGSGL